MQVILDVSGFQDPAQLDALLKKAPDEIDVVYVKLTQGTTYLNSAADQLASVAKQNNTAVAYYHFLTNEQCVSQAVFFVNQLKSVAVKPTRRPMVDAEPPYNLGLPGVEHFADQLKRANTPLPIVYANLSDMNTYRYYRTGLDLWVAAYDGVSRQASDTEFFKTRGYAAWQFTDSYANENQDASEILKPEVFALG